GGDKGGAQQVTITDHRDGTTQHAIVDTEGNKTSSTEVNGQIVDQIEDQQGNKTTTTQTKDQIMHQVQDAQGNFSRIIQQAGQILMMVKGSGGTTTVQLTPAKVSINDANTISQMPTSPPAVPRPGDPPLPLEQLPLTIDLETIELVS